MLKEAFEALLLESQENDPNFNQQIDSVFQMALALSSVDGTDVKDLLLLWSNYLEFSMKNIKNEKQFMDLFESIRFKSLPFWKIAIGLAIERSDHLSVHKFFQIAISLMPYNSSLWQNFKTYEASHQMDNVKTFVDGNNDLSDSSNWNKIFSLRSDEDWRHIWHSEKHKRCYQDLIDHMEWVCDKDIYKLRKKRDLIEVETFTNGPFLLPKEANNMFGIFRFKKSNNKRIRKRGIIDECCNGSAGCSWEEYAEYCPANGRLCI
ncbi:unnamed protein product [Oppiella nova]|uniref:Insulin-like domain-containing protein n=1 Tax=Oppiella nova TaxID=334625 RepID=A0A7R9LSE9_9ACAR|nr:unnamed protein product [Oppiella nova]CAG2165757.1 unnamed protein product [Oppiella nova]